MTGHPHQHAYAGGETGYVLLAKGLMSLMSLMPWTRSVSIRERWVWFGHGSGPCPDRGSRGTSPGMLETDSAHDGFPVIMANLSNFSNSAGCLPCMTVRSCCCVGDEAPTQELGSGRWRIITNTQQLYREEMTTTPLETQVWRKQTQGCTQGSVSAGRGVTTAPM